MDRFIESITQRLAQRPSRRGFIGKMLGVTAGITGIAAAAAPNVAEAASLRCCTGAACPQSGCPTNTVLNYTWSCGRFYCNDCYNSSGTYVCTFVVRH
jgi:hypothetical protein